ncbi:AAA family ATPase [Spirosoma soli]|uniref:AAA family ATPase n=1 Tax=Spirosoma soli TaxID=1770529 RepID=A0ABW5M4T1_9BACT
MTITLPERALVVLVGVSSSGKSTFAQRHFTPTEVVSSDHYRAVVSNDENDQTASKDAFELVHSIVDKRLRRGLLTVVDATNLKTIDRKSYLLTARHYGVATIAIVFDLPQAVLLARHRARPDRSFEETVLDYQLANLENSREHLPVEEFQAIYILNSEQAIESVEMIRTSQVNSYLRETGPFDIIGDVHGCYDELVELLTKLEYDVAQLSHPKGRKIIFVGDLVDRGPNSAGVLRLVMQLVQQGTALCVTGNHDDKLRRKLRGNKVSMTHGLADTVAQVEAEPSFFRQDVRRFLENLPYYIRLDGGRLLVAHAGLREDLHGRTGETVRAFCLFGATNGQLDALGLPVRLNWAADYKGKTTIVYGHTPVAEAVWLNNTIDIDTGCAFGGKLTALRYPERELVSVAAKRLYAVPSRPFLAV